MYHIIDTISTYISLETHMHTCISVTNNPNNSYDNWDTHAYMHICTHPCIHNVGHSINCIPMYMQRPTISTEQAL